MIYGVIFRIWECMRKLPPGFVSRFCNGWATVSEVAFFRLLSRLEVLGHGWKGDGLDGLDGLEGTTSSAPRRA